MYEIPPGGGGSIASSRPTSSVQSKETHWLLVPFSLKDRVDHLLHYVNGEILGSILLSSEDK